MGEWIGDLRIQKDKILCFSKWHCSLVARELSMYWQTPAV